MTLEEFDHEYRNKKPVILRNVNNNEDFAKRVSLEALVEDYGSKTVVLSSSNTYSYDKSHMSLKEYIETVVDHGVSLRDEANTTFYMFGDNYDTWLETLLEDYDQVYLGHDDQALSFGIGGHLSGVPFHIHGGGFSEVLYGCKRWFLYPEGVTPEFLPDETALTWVAKRAHAGEDEDARDARLLECTIRPGEVLYFPSAWYHAALNIGRTVFVSSFIREAP